MQEICIAGLLPQATPSSLQGRQRLSPADHTRLGNVQGRVEFTEYFPENTQGILVQPVGDEGVLMAATDTQRGFGSLDQVRLGLRFASVP